MQKIILFLLFLFFSACDAPRNNPLDIHNPNREMGMLEGRVYSLSIPHKPLPEAQVYFAKDSILLPTDQNGYFSLSNLLRNNGWLYFSKQNYYRDSVYINWNGEPKKNIEIYLNARPVLDSLIFFSSITNRWPDIQILELTVQACIRDADNDIDSVIFCSPGLQYSTLLIFDTNEKRYEKKRITTAQLGISAAEEVIGHTFHITVKDQFDHFEDIHQTQIQRIIRDEVELVSPSGQEIVSRRPNLRWKPVTPGYQFTYLVEVLTDETDPQLVWQKENLLSGASQIQVDIDLPEIPINKYIWAVWIIDRFGNSARSKYKKFQVE